MAGGPQTRRHAVRRLPTGPNGCASSANSARWFSARWFSIEAAMRRPLSILIVAIFAFGPLSALLPGAEEAQLPACCRRHGAHHCAMAATMSAPPPGTQQVTAPNRCPFYRTGLLVLTPVFALAHGPAAAGFCAVYLAPAQSLFATLDRSHIPSSRGPPAAC